MGPTAGLDGCGKSRPPPGFDPRTVQSVASRYTDWAIPAAHDIFNLCYNSHYAVFSGNHSIEDSWSISIFIDMAVTARTKLVLPI